MYSLSSRLAVALVLAGPVGCVTLADDREQEAKSVHRTVRDEQSFTVISQPAEFLAFWVQDVKDEGSTPKPRHVRVFGDATLEVPNARNGVQAVLRTNGKEVFPTDTIVQGAVVNDSDVPALFILADGKEFMLAPGAGLIITHRNANDTNYIECAQCAKLAEGTCGKGCVTSVECGGEPSGSCKFGCKVPCPLDDSQ